MPFRRSAGEAKTDYHVELQASRRLHTILFATHPTTQNGLLRSAWKFNGNIVSDCDAVADAYQPHNYTSTVCLLSQSLHLIHCDRSASLSHFTPLACLLLLT